MDDAEPDGDIDAIIDPDTRVAEATTLLGEPEAFFKASPGRIRAKFALAAALILYGIAANIGWFGFGPGKFGHFEFHLLFLPPVIGGGLLWHLWRHRGLRVLIFPTGLLRLQRGEVDSFPWDEIAAVRMKITPHGEPQIVRDDNGEITSAWLNTTAPTFQVWNVWLELARTDGATAKMTAVLADFPELVAEVQRRSFPALWALTKAALAAGLPVEFSEGLTVTAYDVTQGKVTIRWEEMKYLKLSGKLLSIKRKGAWLSGAIARDATTINNLHVLFALAAENNVLEELEEGDDD